VIPLHLTGFLRQEQVKLPYYTATGINKSIQSLIVYTLIY
jgi:hypothetical protein